MVLSLDYGPGSSYLGRAAARSLIFSLDSDLGRSARFSSLFPGGNVNGVKKC